MYRRFNRLLRGLVALAPVWAGSAWAFAGEPHPVQARLVADADPIAPGQPFRLGVELRMEPGWHTYWQSSGDAGMPTEIEWQLPAGFSVGPLAWPLPHKYEEDGGLTVYGYADETFLTAVVQAPAELPDTTLTIAAQVSWLVCREICIPGQERLEMSLAVDQRGGSPAHAELFERYQSQVPEPLDTTEVNLQYSVGQEGANYAVELKLGSRGAALVAAAGAPDFYPLGSDAALFYPVVRLAGERVGLQVKFEPYGEAPDSLRGVLVYHLEGDRTLRAGTVALALQGAVQTPGLLERDYAVASSEGPRSLGIYLLFAVLGGLILNLMPCVLPVISLKVLSFVSQANQERGRIRALGLAFAGGIVAAFGVLALVVVLLKTGGQQVGWGFQFQYPGFVVAMAGLVFALGLSLFGVFTVQLPGMQGNLAGLADRGGLAGSFFNGVLATILATPCTAPFLGTALGFAFAQPGAVVWLVFLAIGGGMSLPYILLALEPRWMQFIPRPGAWMDRFKQVMGFLLMATVLWLLWVLGKQVGMEGVIWTGAFLLSLALGCWLVGSFIDLASGRRRRLIVWGAAGATVAAAYFVLLDPLFRTEAELAAQPQGEKIVWLDFSPARVEALLAEGRPVFIDFTAEWCWTCKVNERVVLADAAVRAKFAAHDFALVKADWTDGDPEITQLLRAFGRSGVPLYVIFPAGRLDQPVVLPEVITAQMVLDKVDEALVAGMAGPGNAAGQGRLSDD